MILLVAVGCGKSEIEKLIGSYEAKIGTSSNKLVLLENGKAQRDPPIYSISFGTWKLVGRGNHVVFGLDTSVYKIEPNGDLTLIASIYDSKRKDVSKEKQHIFKN